MTYRIYTLHVESDSTPEELDALAEIAARVVFAQVKGEGSSVEAHSLLGHTSPLAAFERE